MLLRGNKNRVFINYWILIFSAMLLIDLPLFAIFLNRCIQQRGESAKQRLIERCQIVEMQSKGLAKPTQDIIDQPISPDERFVFMRASSQPIVRQDDLQRLVLETMRRGSPQSQKYGRALGLVSPQAEYLAVSLPIDHGGDTIAAGGIEIRLTSTYQAFRRLHTVTLVFILINSFFFALFGNQQLGRTYFRPLKRLAKKAESYQDEETLIFSVRKEDNEFSILSSSLNKMVERIRENKKTLEATINSLTRANQELKKAQQEVIRAEKLATVGRLTSGIAHEIGNPIGIVLGYLDLLKQADLADAEREDFIQRSENEITRINGIIRQLLDMSKPSNDELKNLSIHELLDELVSVFSYQPDSEKIAFEKVYAADNDIVFADPDQLRQVFLNIILNAVDAVTGSGQHHAPQIRLSTRMVTGRGGGNQLSPAIRVGIFDNGPGIDPEHHDRLFDPFFTTKEPGKGTGLGLSVSYMIVEKFNGELGAHCPETGGTEFTVNLPVVAGHAKRANQD